MNPCIEAEVSPWKRQRSIVQTIGLVLAQQFNRGRVVADLPSADQEADGHPQFVCQQVNLGRQSASGTPQSLIAPFLRPVAACW
jgi:hypothetical protein